MDAVDIRILRAMGPFPYAPRANGSDALRPARIAREVGLSPETVRDRIARMEGTGVIAGYEIVPNLRHLGLSADAFLIRPPDEPHRERLRNSLGLVEGLLEVTYFLGTEACVDLSFQTPGQRATRLRALAEASGDPSPLPFLGWRMPAVERSLSHLDWRIVRALRGRAKRSLVEVAEELGVGYRTVKRHYDRMAEEGSFFVKPLLNPAAEPGVVPFVLLFFFEDPADRQAPGRILRALDEHVVFAHPPASLQAGNFDVLVFASSAMDVERLRQKGAAVPGVTRVQALVLTDVDSRMDWIDELLDAKLAAAAAASGSGAPDPAR
ncbi:MAG TPA: Lrp/AsnC family transcriptional regulator [Candidatus Thermoplasmatota archaeon]|nr:Lrp/AsnC family transcriptional regulator [Candidatus Thermoplasmatota archaeon]